MAIKVRINAIQKNNVSPVKAGFGASVLFASSIVPFAGEKAGVGR